MSEFDIKIIEKGLLSRNLQLISDNLQNFKVPSEELSKEIIDSEEIRNLLFSHWQWDDAGEEHDPICEWFYAWYQTKNERLQNFVLSYLPEMTWTFLFKFSHATTPTGIQSVLVEIYNCELSEREGKDSFFCCPPPVSQPQTHVKQQKSNFLSEIALQAHTQESDFRKVKLPTFRAIDFSAADFELSSAIFYDILLLSFRQFSRRLPEFSKYAHRSFITMLSLLYTCGYSEDESKVEFYTLDKVEDDTFALIEKKTQVSNKYGSVKAKQNITRSQINFDAKKSYDKCCIYLPVNLQLQFLQIVAYLLYAERIKKQALKVLYLIQARAEIDISHEILLITNALLHKNSLDRIK